MPSRAQAARHFHDLHRGPDILILANAWDAGSARLVESLGAKAVATTSAGFAWALGYPDGDAVPLDELVHHVRLMARAIDVPLSIDMEGGFGADPAAVGAAVSQVVSAGAIGMNIEDGSQPPELLAAKITTARAAAAQLGVDAFVNARIDVYLRQLVPPAERVAESLRRAKIYSAAGASGIFVPAVTSADEIAALAKGIDRPLNVLAWPGLPAASELARLGVRRLSAGAGLTKLAWGRTATAAKAFLADGESALFSDGAMDSATANGLYKR